MISFWKCFAYLAVIGFVAHFVGLGLSHVRFRYHNAPWRAAAFEQEGKFWDRKFKVRRWMNAVPDMSRICPDMVPKRIVGTATVSSVDRLIRETCVAELIHTLLIVFGFGSVIIWNGTGGWVVSILFGVGNVPFIIIQRYNRPRLVRLHAWLVAREQGKQPGNQPEEDTEVVRA